MEKLTNNDFIERSRKIHGNKYDYSKTEYINAKTKVCVICPNHGEFWVRPAHHLNGVGCAECAGIKRKTKEQFIASAKNIHKDRYDYTKVNYVNSKIKVCIICPKHGEFWQAPNSHLSGCGCPKCAKTGVLSNTMDFIEKAKQVHGDRYDYSKTKYINAKSKVTIICYRHGEFEQEADSHLSGKGCPKCKSSKLENIVLNNLSKNNIDYIYQFKLKSLGWKSIDFYLPKYNIAIECQGEQHYVPISFVINDTENINPFNNLLDRQKIDELKYNECKRNKIELIYFVIPQYFHKKEVNVTSGFYDGKTVFTRIEDLINYIKSKGKNNDTDNFIDFCNEIQKLYLGIIVGDNRIYYKNKIFLFNKSKTVDKTVLKSVTRHYKKSLYKTYYIFEDEYINNKETVLNEIKQLL